MNAMRSDPVSATRPVRRWRMLLAAALPAFFLTAIALPGRGEDEVPVPDDAAVLEIIAAQELALPPGGVVPPPDARPAVAPPATRPTTLPTTVATTEPAGPPPPVFDPEESPQTRPAGGDVGASLLQRTKNFLTSKRSGRSSVVSSGDLAALAKIDPLPPSKPLPVDYQILRTRSIFSKTKPVVERVRSGNEDRPPRDEPRLAPPPEAALSLTGLSIQNGEPYAFVEDASAGKTLRVRAGDPIANGKITDMTLMSLDYEAKGKVTKVMIGQNFTGSASSLPGTRPAVATAPTPTPGVGPRPGPGAAPSVTPPAPPAGGPGLDPAERMRLRRLQELGGGPGK